MRARPSAYTRTLVLCAALGLAMPAMESASAESVVRIGMTAADIPRTLGQPDQGFEGNRFTGNTMYEGLTTWDLSSAEKPSVVIPGLATEWNVDPNDKTKWVFKLRRGVKFHDGLEFNAEAVVWNVVTGTGTSVPMRRVVFFPSAARSRGEARMRTLESVCRK